MMLTTATVVKARLGITHNEHDTIITQFIEAASAQVEQYLNRVLTAAAYTEYFDGPRSVLQLKAYPVTTVSAVIESTDMPRNWTASANLISTSDYVVDYTNGMLRRIDGGSFASGPMTIRVNYHGGYTAAQTGELPVPDGIKWPTVDQVVYYYRNRDAIGQSGRTIGDGSTNLYEAWGLLKGVRNALRAYRRPVLL